MSESNPSVIEPEAIHGWFGLSYCNYMVLHRTLLQSMPDDWQCRFVEMLQEYHQAFAHVDEAAAYDVRVLARLPELIKPEEDCQQCDGSARFASEECLECEGFGTYYGEMRYETAEETGVVADPVPHYNRGRTRIEPAVTEPNPTERR